MPLTRHPLSARLATGSNYRPLTHGTPIVLVNNFKPATRTFRYPVDMVNSIRQIRDRSAAPRGAQVILGVTKMQLGDRDELSAQIRDYDTCFAEFLEPSGNGQKILQAILLDPWYGRTQRGTYVGKVEADKDGMRAWTSSK